MLAVLPVLPVNADNARAVAQAFNDKIVEVRTQNKITSDLAWQLHADIYQQMNHWPETDRTAFKSLFDQCLREINAARHQAIAAMPQRKPIMFYFMIFTCIKVVSFILVATYAWIVGPAIFNSPDRWMEVMQKSLTFIQQGLM